MDYSWKELMLRPVDGDVVTHLAVVVVVEKER
jgi:hypothetical protein